MKASSSILSHDFYDLLAMHGVTNYRASFTRSHHVLRRARHLYALFIRHACERDATGQKIINAAKRAIEAGLYAAITQEKGVRYSLLRKFGRYHGYHDTREWHVYFRKYGWEPLHWIRTPGFNPDLIK